MLTQISATVWRYHGVSSRPLSSRARRLRLQKWRSPLVVRSQLSSFRFGRGLVVGSIPGIPLERSKAERAKTTHSAFPERLENVRFGSTGQSAAMTAMSA